MKINDLSKQLEVTNRQLIDYLKSLGYNVSSHMQNAQDEWIEAATKYFESQPKEAKEIKEATPEATKKTATVESEKVSTKKFSPDDLIPCRSVTPWRLNAVGSNTHTVYHWEYFGDVDYIAYSDLQAMRRKSIVTKPKIIIEDPDICSQWRREIGDIYAPFLGVEYPEELFDLSDDDFEKLLKTSSDTVREVIKVTAVNMVKNKNYPSLNKLELIDNITGTCIKEFV